MQISAFLCKCRQNSAELCRRDTGYQRVHWRRRWQDGRGSRSFLPEHSETFQSISKHFVTSRCHSLLFVAELTWAASVGRRTETKFGPVGWRRIPTAGGRARQKPPPLISMAAHCAHAALISRRTRQSRLPDRKAARDRRGLDGRRAVVTRIFRGAPAGLHSLVLRALSRPGLGLASSVRGV